MSPSDTCLAQRHLIVECFLRGLALLRGFGQFGSQLSDRVFRTRIRGLQSGRFGASVDECGLGGAVLCGGWRGRDGDRMQRKHKIE